MNILNRVYGFSIEDVKTIDNGSWIMEHAVDSDMSYTAKILSDGSVYITVETLDKFPKLVTEYKLDKLESHELTGKATRGHLGKQDR